MERAFWDRMASLENTVEATARSLGVPEPRRMALPMLPVPPFAPAMDLMASDGDLVIRIDVPGVNPSKGLSVTAVDGVLIVSGERREPTEVKERTYFRRETFKGAFERHVPIPVGVALDRITAGYADGVLEVVVPEGIGARAEAGPRSVRVDAPTPVSA